MITRRIMCSIAPLFLLLSIQVAGYSQTPQGFTYQAVVRDAAGAPLGNKTVGVKITLEDASHVAYYSETHSRQTNAQGVITIAIGSGSRVGDNLFENIPWINGDVSLKLEIDPEGGNNYVQIGVATKLQAVPYALYAENVKEVSSLADATDTDPIFVVKNKTGQIVFAVYQSGVRMFVDDLSVKGAKGGFAIGGLTSKATSDYFLITPDSARVSLKTPAKGAKGGFAIGGLTSKGVNNYLQLTPDNYFIGHNAGSKNTAGRFNSVIGYESALNNTEGSDNIFIGYQSGYSNTLGLYNVFIGKKAGYNNIGAIQTIPYYLEYGSYNVFIGNSAGFNNKSGWTNLFLGNLSGYGNISGSDNTYIGNFCGENNSNGWGNAFLGAFSGRANLEGNTNVYVGFYSGNMNVGSSNTFIGAYSGEKNVNGQNNTFIGTQSGNNSSGHSNVFIGSLSGYNETGSHKLYIDNSDTPTPLIYGEFDNDILCFNAKVGIGTAAPDKKLHVDGDARITGDLFYGTGTTIYSKPDFVFTKDYNSYLEPLKVDEFIKTNGHLPWMTSSTAETDGINLTRMQFETVETVENLQLQIIELKKDYENKIQKLEDRLLELEKLKTELESIKNLLSAK